MLGDCRAGDVEPGGDLPGGELLPEDQTQDLPAARLGDGVEDGFHDERCSNRLHTESIRLGPVRHRSLPTASSEL